MNFLDQNKRNEFYFYKSFSIGGLSEKFVNFEQVEFDFWLIL